MDKEYKKRIMKSIKKIAKKMGFHTIADYIYKKDDNLIIYALYWIDGNNKISFRWCFKTIEIDNLFWDIFCMPENKEKSFSIRINGAFCCPPYIFWEERAYDIVNTENIERMEEEIAVILGKNAEQVTKYLSEIINNYSNFYEYMVARDDSDDLIKMLSYILLGEYKYVYKLAKQNIKNGESGGFENKGKDIYEYIKKYCRKKYK